MRVQNLGTRSKGGEIFIEMSAEDVEITTESKGRKQKATQLRRQPWGRLGKRIKVGASSEK